MQRLAGGCRQSRLHLNAYIANRHRLEGRQPHRHTSQRQQASFVVKAVEAGSSTDVAANSSRTALGEDSAAFDSKQQSTQSWMLFTGLLLGVLGLIYVVRTCAHHCTTWSQLLFAPHCLFTCLSCSCMCSPPLHMLCCPIPARTTSRCCHNSNEQRLAGWQASGHHLSAAADVLAAADALRLHLQTWIDPDTGVANQFLDSLKSISSNTEVVMLLILGVFAAAHSGLAYLRPYGELQ